ncbi:hypothetical protein QYF61_007187 [Mycteria americana]|uniref:Reverse transcriptase domain-containing protein n=1 Tax=Mycteria americana TaxID=33587 RepID=A0AAN7N130_MYCAM|nr:hypothetical protein QYF61_007187 [Mycteria americana]
MESPADSGTRFRPAHVPSQAQLQPGGSPSGTVARLEAIGQPLSIAFEKLWRSGDIPEDWKKANVTPIYKKGLKEDRGNYRLISHTSVPGKVVEWILLGAITSQMKHMIEKSQHGFTKGKLCLTHLMAFYDKVTCLVDVGRVVAVVYLDFSKAFDTVSRSFLLE